MKSLSPREFRILASIALIAVFLVLGFVIANVFVLRQVGPGGEFLLPWKAVRAFLFERVEPYSSAVSGAVQEQVYGRTVLSSEDPYILDIPFHLLLLYFPLALFRDPLIAGALWLLLCEAALLSFILLSLVLTDWQPKRAFLYVFTLVSSLGIYSLFGLLEGSQVLILSVLYGGILFSLRNAMDELAGALVAFSFYRWETGFVFLVLVSLYVFDERRWRVLAGFGMVTVLLVAVSVFLYPDWLWSFLRAVISDLRFDHGYSPAIVFEHFWPGMGGRLGWGLSLLLIILVAVEWSAARKMEFRRFYWASCLGLAVTPLIGFRVEIEYLVVLILPLAVIFSVVRERWKAGYWLASLLLLLVYLVPWGLFVGAGLTRDTRLDLIYLFLPAFTVIGLYWTRWWALRPPRTWLERAASNEYR